MGVLPRVILQLIKQIQHGNVVEPILFVHVQQFLGPHQAGNSLEIVVFAVDPHEGFAIEVVDVHNNSQSPDIDGRGDVEGEEELFGGVVADGSPFVADVDPFVVETGKVPVDQLNLVEFEVRTY